MMPRTTLPPTGPSRISSRLKKPPGLKRYRRKRGACSVDEILSNAYRRHCREPETLDAVRLCLEGEASAS